MSEPQGRDALFTAACRRFAEIYDLEENLQFTPPGSLAEQTYGLTLAVHMAALSVVDAHAQGHTPPAGSGDLSTYLLARERRYWQRLHDRTATAAARCVFVAALTGPLTHSAGRALLDQIGLPAGHSTTSQELLDAHARCYPPTAPGTVLEPLYPDRLAEAFVALTLTGPHPQGDTWAAATITRSAAHQPGQYRG